MAKSSTKEAVVQVPLNDVLGAFHPNNPREHSLAEGGDILAIADSLLEVGFATTLTMQEGGYLLSGHGRAAACDWLRQQSEEFFEFRWEKWLAQSPERKDIAHLHHERFTPNFWNRVPVTIVKLDEATQKSTLLRLNNQSKDGRDQPKKLAALLAELPKESIDHAGWTEKNANAFISAFAIRKKEQAPEPEEENTEFQGKQYFERPDATDYSGSGNGMSNNAIAESGSVNSSFDSDDDEEEDWDEEGGDEGGIDGDDGLSIRPSSVAGEDIVMADVDSDVGDYKVEGVQYDTAIAEARAVLLMDNAMLVRYKELAKPVAERLGIDTVSESIKLWRPKCVLAALEYVMTHAPQSILPSSEEN